MPVSLTNLRNLLIRKNFSWCHVMNTESFENPATAEIMNNNFVNIKLDREERPDVDKIYMVMKFSRNFF